MLAYERIIGIVEDFAKDETKTPWQKERLRRYICRRIEQLLDALQKESEEENTSVKVKETDAQQNLRTN